MKTKTNHCSQNRCNDRVEKKTHTHSLKQSNITRARNTVQNRKRTQHDRKERERMYGWKERKKEKQLEQNKNERKIHSSLVSTVVCMCVWCMRCRVFISSTNRLTVRRWIGLLKMGNFQRRKNSFLFISATFAFNQTPARSLARDSFPLKL